MKNFALVTLGSSPGSGVANGTRDSQFNINWRKEQLHHSFVYFTGAQTFIWYGVASIFGEVVFNFGFSS